MTPEGGGVSLTSIGLPASDPPPVSTTVRTYLSSPVSSPGAKFVGEEDEDTAHTGLWAYAGAAEAPVTVSASTVP